MMKRLFACIFLLIPAVLFAQVSPNVNVPANGVASTVIPISSSYQNGNVVRVTNGSTSTDCTTGGGTNAVLCYWTGSAWAPASGSGTGSVTSFSASALSPLFTTSTATPTTTPALSFSLNTQSANLIFAGPSSGAAAAPTFRALGLTDLPSTLAQFTGAITVGDCAKWSSAGVLADQGAACGSGGGFAAGGDLSGTSTSQNVIGFDFGGTHLTLGTVPSSGQCLEYNGTSVTGAACSSTGVSWAVNTVTFSATPVFNASLGNVQKITLTGNVTSSTLTNAVAGQLLTFDVCQDATGGRSFVWPTNMVGTFTIPQGANQCVRQSFAYDGTNAVAQDASQGDGFLLAASSALEPNARTLTCGSGISCVDGGAGGSFNISGSSLVDLTSTQTITGTKTLAGPLVHQFANAASPGTTQYESVMVAASGTVTAGTASTGVIGVCIIGCGTSGNASVAVEGVVNAMFDTASITAGDYVTATASGTFHDTGSAAYPASGQVQGKIITSGTTCNTSPGCPFLKFPEEIEAASGGASAWSGLTNAGANLTLSNGAYSTTFNQTSSANWLWANTTAATSSVEADSPILQLKGNNWSGATPASAADSWTIQDVTGAGANPVSTLTLSHSGSSTATPNAQISLNGMMVAPNSITTPAGNTLILTTTTPTAGVYIGPGGTARVGIGSTGMTFEQGGDTLTGIEGTCNATAATGDDILCLGNSTAHDAELSLNGAAYVPIATVSGTITAGDCAKFISAIAVGDSGSACGGSGLPASWSVAGTTNAVTGKPAASQDATTLALAPSLASGGTADIFDVCSTLPCSSGTKYFSVGFNGAIGMNVSNFTLSTAGAAPYFGLDASGGTPAQGYLKYITAQLSTPTACSAATATTGGTWAAGTYWFECTYVNAAGETVNQTAFSVTTTGSTSTVTINAPGLSSNAFGFQVYCYSSTPGSTPCTSSAAAPAQSGYGLVIPASAQCTLSTSTFHSNAVCYPNANATWTAAPTPTTASAPTSNTTGNLPSSIDALQNSAEGYGLCVAQGSSSSDCAAGSGLSLPGGTGLSLSAGTTPTTSGNALAGTLACFSGSLAAAQCAANATNAVGVFTAGYQIATVQTTGIATIKLAASATTTAGHFACTNATAGTVADSASACAAGQQAGYIAQTNGTAVSSVPVLLTLSGAPGGSSGSPALSSVTASVANSSLSQGTNNWSLNGSAPAAVSSGNGTAGTDVLDLTSGGGGATSAASATGGLGGGFLFTTGAGGNATGTTATGGNGGDYVVAVGAGGTGTSAAGNIGRFMVGLGGNVASQCTSGSYLACFGNSSALDFYVSAGGNIGTSGSITGGSSSTLSIGNVGAYQTLSVGLSTNFSVNSSGRVTNYNSTVAKGNGLPYEVYSTATASTAAAISSTTMFTVGASAQNFDFSGSVSQVNVGAGCTGNTTVAVNVIYTDNLSGLSVTEQLPVTAGGATASTLPLTTGTIGASNVGSFSFHLDAKASTSVSFSTTYTEGPGCTTAPSYGISPVLRGL